MVNRLGLTSALFFVSFLRVGEAVIIHDEANNASFYNVSDATFNGVGRIVYGSTGVCSAFAINAFQVLTAAHCTPQGNPALNGSPGVRFDLFNLTVLTPTAVFVNPGFDINDAGGGNDLAVLYFANGLDPLINTYPVYNGPTSDLGMTFQLLGFGRCGTPQTGWAEPGPGCATPGLHRGVNRFDHLTSNEVLQFSFDSYNTALASNGCRVNDGLCWLTGVNAPIKSADANIDDLQGMIARGDSGGPSLFLDGGQYYSVGLHSYVTCFASGNTCASPPNFDGSTSANGSWGEVGGDTRLRAFESFILDSTVPEPSALALAGLGLVALACHRRRIMLDSSKSAGNGLAHGEGPSHDRQA